MADAPKRIQRRRVKGWRMPEGAVYVGRPGGWGNPFAHRDPAIAVRRFRCWIIGSLLSPTIMEARPVARHQLAERRQAIRQNIESLRGHDLACWCALDQPCHADVLLELANGPLRCEAEMEVAHG